MPDRSLPPPHPSLPPPPHSRATFAYSQPTTAQYPNQYKPAFSSHYAQAYMNFPSATTPTRENGALAAGPSFSRSNMLGSAGGPNSQLLGFNTPAAWYQPGNSKCTFKGCSFTASPKTLEIHMMDRHLIYPPGWEKRQKKPDWDADPSLKGKPIPIQGTIITLDSPEVLEAWIAERKKRWPTALRVQEKKRKMEEAVARGQLAIGDNGLARKRRRTDQPQDADRVGDRGQHSFSDRARGRGRGTDSGWEGRGRGKLRSSLSTSSCKDNTAVSPHFDTETESDAEPEVVSSKGHPKITQPATTIYSDSDDINRPVEVARQPAKRTSPDTRKISKPQPLKKEPHNPFASRPTLLRNLLLPEIRMTISNLSHAIRFLADNDFLRGVELKAGEANQKMIEVISDDMGTL